MKKTILTMLLMATTAIAALADDEISVWDGEAEDTNIYLDTKAKTFYVYTAAQFAGLHKKMNDYMVSGHHGYDGYTILLMNDIDLNNKNFTHRTIGWDSDHRFGGKLDGQGHTIYNLYIEQKHDNRGIVGWMCGGDIVNLKVENVSVEAGNDDDEAYVGAICGRMQNHSVISHCAVINGKVDVWNWNDDDFVGAICGYVSDDNDYPNAIEYCYAHNVEVRGHKQVGGIVGRVDEDTDTPIRNCYFSGKITSGGKEYYGAIVGERWSNKMENNFYLNRNDGVKSFGSGSGSRDCDTDKEIKPCTDAELKAPLLFGANDKEWVYRLDGYPELKVFFRYDKGDTFYEKSIGYKGKTLDVPGYVKVVDNEGSPYKVELVKIVPKWLSKDFTVRGGFNTYFSNQPLRMDVLAANIFQNMGELNTVTLPNTLTSISTPQRHQVQNAFVLNGNVAGCSVQDGVLYDATKSTLITAPKTFSTMTIHQQYADRIADYAFENMNKLQTLYVDTYVPAGTLVDESANKAPVMQFEGTHTFDGCSSNLDIYIKDGTTNQLFFGKQGPKGYGYCNADKWMHFYDDHQDGTNHMFSYFPVQRNAGSMSTLMLGYPVELPEGVTAWWARSLSNGRITLQRLGTQIVPALTPVLLTYEGSGPLYLSRYEGSDAGAATDYEDNLFKGSVDPGGHSMTSSERMSNFFTLGRPAGDSSYDRLGFYQYHPKNNLLPSYVAWFANSDIRVGAPLLMDFSDNAVTDIANTINSQLSTVNSQQVFTLQGVRIDPSDMQKGTLYIINGKKVIMR